VCRAYGGKRLLYCCAWFRVEREISAGIDGVMSQHRPDAGRSQMEEDEDQPQIAAQMQGGKDHQRLRSFRVEQQTVLEQMA
jgi:hypothetical protein